jgi:protein TonB
MNGAVCSSPTGALMSSDQGLRSISETLLGTGPARQPYLLIAVGIGVYFLTLGALLTVDFSAPPMTLEAPMEMVYDEPAQPEQQPEPPQPPEQAQAEPEKLPEPEPVVEQAAPETPPEAKPEPKVQPKPVEPRPDRPKPKPRPAQQPAQHSEGAVPSDYANTIYQRINRVAGGSLPRGALAPGQSVRISYVIVIGASGELNAKTVTPSGNAALDQAVSQALSRSAPFPAPPSLGARSYRISGAIVYRP